MGSPRSSTRFCASPTAGMSICPNIAMATAIVRSFVVLFRVFMILLLSIVPLVSFRVRSVWHKSAHAGAAVHLVMQSVVGVLEVDVETDPLFSGVEQIFITDLSKAGADELITV